MSNQAVERPGLPQLFRTKYSKQNKELIFMECCCNPGIPMNQCDIVTYKPLLAKLPLAPNSLECVSEVILFRRSFLPLPLTRLLPRSTRVERDRACSRPRHVWYEKDSHECTLGK